MPAASPAPRSVNRTLFLIAVGVCAGYTIGFRDARTHDKTVVERTLERVGGRARGQYNSDIDGAAEREAGEQAAPRP